MSRQKSPRNFPEHFEASEEERRFGTPIEVADYRAERLKCHTILEIGCGVGFQTVAFAKTCKKVIAIDIDEERIKKAKRNLAKYEIRNVEFHAVDALDKEFIQSLKRVDIIFCDPGRAASEEERKLASLSPSLPEIQNAYTCDNIAYEVPPFLKHLPKEAEKEYITLNGTLNRLMLYFGDCKQRELSIVDVPSGERLEQEETEERTISDPTFIAEVNEAITNAELEEVLANKLKGMVHKEHEKITILTKHITPSAFVRWYRIVPKFHPLDVVLHYPIPQGKYKDEKMRHIKQKGKENAHLFRLNGEIVYTVRMP